MPRTSGPLRLQTLRSDLVEDFSFGLKKELFHYGTSDPSRRHPHTDACVRSEQRRELSCDGAPVERTLSVLEPRGSLV
ncbi:hypothetical protein Baya_3034 [Bagarius yarrelli]|uniref:Uncharacterized protein n=1 Tax=Bagarius yarrelli TaxID=175774 RepID=A0A556TU92_BAGYA|nr:hypothetical protein Baya_3034 [Bagarius yarrelli]